MHDSPFFSFSFLHLIEIRPKICKDSAQLLHAVQGKNLSEFGWYTFTSIAIKTKTLSLAFVDFSFLYVVQVLQCEVF